MLRIISAIIGAVIAIIGLGKMIIWGIIDIIAALVLLYYLWDNPLVWLLVMSLFVKALINFIMGE